MKAVGKIGKLIAALILIPIVSLCVIILFYAVTGKEFTPVKNIVKEASITTEVEEQSTGIAKTAEQVNETEQAYVLNTATFEIHIPTCMEVLNIIQENKMELTDTKASLEAGGFKGCSICKS